MRLEGLAYITLRYDGPIRAAAPYPGGDGRGFGTGTGRIDGERINGSLKWVNIPTVRSDNMVCSDFNGMIEPDEGDIVLFRIEGYAIPSVGEGPGVRIKRDGLFHLHFTSAGQDYAWMNSVFAIGESAVLSQAEHLIGVKVYECRHDGPGQPPR